jgi:hypothetical protein
MKINLNFAELHTPLFLGGTNWGVKLYTHQAKGHLVLTYDREEKELLIRHKNDISIIPTSNVVSMSPEPEGIEVEKKPEVIKRPPGRPPVNSAQVSGPTHHVFADGPGKTRD